MAGMSTEDKIALGSIVGMAGVGVYMLNKKPGVKKEGSKVSARITVKALGTPSGYVIGFGLAQGRSVGHNPIKQFFTITETISLTPEVDQYDYDVTGKLNGTFQEGDLDAFIFVQKEGEELDPEGKGYLVSKWYDEVYKAG